MQEIERHDRGATKSRRDAPDRRIDLGRGSQVISCSKVEAPWRGCADGAPAFVIHLDSAGQDGLQTKTGRTPTEFQVFKTEEILLVEQSGSLEHLTPDQHETPAHRIDGTIRW